MSKAFPVLGSSRVKQVPIPRRNNGQDKEVDTEEESLPRVSLEISGSKGQIPGFLRDPDLETHLSIRPVVTSQREGRSRGDLVVCGLHPGNRGTPRNVHFERETLERKKRNKLSLELAQLI